MTSYFEIQAGRYKIGDDSLPLASPCHFRTLSANVWISSQLVSWAQYEAFVTAGGYTRRLVSELSNSSIGKDESNRNLGFSVDRRIEQVLDIALLPVAEVLGNVPRPSLPITALTWFESRAIAAFFGGRLPYEIEWEVMQLTSINKEPLRFQEWTLDAFAKYWRADSQRPGRPWTSHSNGGISIRGARPNDTIRSVPHRHGDSPWNSEIYRGFRIAWDLEPQLGQFARH